MDKLNYTYKEIADTLDELWEAETGERVVQDKYSKILDDFNDYMSANIEELKNAGFPVDAIKNAVIAGLDSCEQEKPINDFGVDCSGLTEVMEYDKFDIFKK